MNNFLYFFRGLGCALFSLTLQFICNSVFFVYVALANSRCVVVLSIDLSLSANSKQMNVALTQTS